MPRPKAPPRVQGPYPDRGGTRFRVRIFWSDLARKDLYFRSERDALAAMAQVRQELARSHSPKLTTLIDDYFADKLSSGRLTQTTCEEQRARVRSFLRDVLDVEIVDLSPERAAQLYRSLVTEPSAKTGQPMAAASHRLYLSLVKSMFAWAVRHGLLSRSPFAEVQPVGRVSVGKPQLRIAEAKLFLQQALRRYDESGSALALGAAVALLLGLRASELLTRRVRDVDEGGAILWIDAGKTRNARRFLDVPEVLQTRLRLLAGQRDHDEPLFGRGRTGKLHPRQVFWRAVTDLCQAAGIPKVCPHSLRGLWATLGVQTGALPSAIAASLGHGSFRMTEKHYAQPEVVRGATTASVQRFLQLSDDPHSPRLVAAQLAQTLPAAVLDELLRIHRGDKA